MGCLVSHLSKVLMIAALYFVLVSGLIAGERDDLYKEGLAAYSKKDYAQALKKLYAYYILNEIIIENNPDFKKSLIDLISFSESVLTLAFASNSSVPNKDGVVRFYYEHDSTFVGEGLELPDYLKRKGIDFKTIEKLSGNVLKMPSSEYSQ